MSTRATSLADLAGQGTGMFGSVTDDAPAPASEPVVTADQITWSKLDGEWFVRIPAAVEHKAGQVVTVTKKEGGTVQAELIEQHAVKGQWQFWVVKQFRAPSSGKRRSNRYEGNCRLCDHHVPAGDGYLGPKENGQWTVEHREGECLDEEVPEPEMADVSDYSEPIWPGVYTVEDGFGHRTFRVVAQRHDAEFAPGATVVEYLKGRDNDNDYAGFAFLREGKLQVWKRFKENEMVSYAAVLVAHADAVALATSRDEAITVEHDGATYSIMAAKNCIRCGRTLSTPESVTAGIGPECMKKGW